MHRRLRRWLLALFSASLLSAQAAAQQPPIQEKAFDAPAASRMLLQLSEALQARSQKKMLAVFDLAKMKEGEFFRQQISSFFSQTESIRVHLNLAELDAENGKANFFVDAEIEVEPRNGAPLPGRKKDRLRFTAANSGGQWKLIDVQPRSFFSSAP